MAFFHLFYLAIKGPFDPKPQTCSRKVFFFNVILSIASHPSLLFSPETVVIHVSLFFGTFSMSLIFSLIIFISLFLTLSY